MPNTKQPEQNKTISEGRMIYRIMRTIFFILDKIISPLLKKLGYSFEYTIKLSDINLFKKIWEK